MIRSVIRDYATQQELEAFVDGVVYATDGNTEGVQYCRHQGRYYAIHEETLKGSVLTIDVEPGDVVDDPTELD